MMVVRSVTARAQLAKPGSELTLARRRAREGDSDWQQWVDEFDRGRAGLIDIRVTIELELEDGRIQTVSADDYQVWVELAQHPPVVAGLVAEISAKDLDLLAARVRLLGQGIAATELDDMYVSVELADDLLHALRPDLAKSAGRGEHAGRLGLVTKPE